MKQIFIFIICALGITACATDVKEYELPGQLFNKFPYGLTNDQIEGSISAGLLKMRWVATDIIDSTVIAESQKHSGVMQIAYTDRDYVIDVLEPWTNTYSMENVMFDLDHYIQKYSYKAAIEGAKVKMRGE